MNWQKWKQGLAVAALTGLLTGIVGLAAGVNARQAAYLIAVSVAKDMLLYLKSNPIEPVQPPQAPAPPKP